VQGYTLSFPLTGVDNGANDFVVRTQQGWNSQYNGISVLGGGEAALTIGGPSRAGAVQLIPTSGISGGHDWSWTTGGFGCSPGDGTRTYLGGRVGAGSFALGCGNAVAFDENGPIILASRTTNPTGIAGGIFYRSDLTRPMYYDTAFHQIPGIDTTDTLTNKTYDTAGVGNLLKLNGNTVLNAPYLITGFCSGVANSSATIGLVGFGENTALTCTAVATDNAAVVISSSGTIKNLRALVSAGGVNASSGVVTIVKNGVAQSLTCTIGTGTTCNDSADSFAIVAGDRIRAQFTTQAAETLADVRVSVEKY
jgi:hypothetical protein